MNANELKGLLSGQIVEFFDGSKSRYSADGLYGYTYNDGGPVWRGTYLFQDDSQVCVAFENGSARCDTFVRDGTTVTLITTDGLRFPVRNITVDQPASP